MMTLDDYRKLNKKEKIKQLERIELLLKFTERSYDETHSEDMWNQFDKLLHYYTIGQIYL